MGGLLVVGQATLDLVLAVEALPQGGLKHTAQNAELVGGGMGANAAVAAARLGGRVTFVTRLGRDMIGQAIA
ncbi:MAG: PfkB family carbohydrate kinase, partial [Pseudomonadota bacterium]